LRPAREQAEKTPESWISIVTAASPTSMTPATGLTHGRGAEDEPVAVPAFAEVARAAGQRVDDLRRNRPRSGGAPRPGRVVREGHGEGADMDQRLPRSGAPCKLPAVDSHCQLRFVASHVVLARRFRHWNTTTIWRNHMACLPRRILASLATLLVAAHAHAYEAGWMLIHVAGTTPDAATTTVALYYPTMAAPRAVAMGPFALDVAIGGKPVDKIKGLILLSHGIGGSELGHSVLAQALARHGYLVAALRHPGDNWQDRSLIEKSPERYFDERPRQASRVIDAILADPGWKDRIATDSQGPRVGALGHSAGGYTVLALAGARPDLSRMRKHCLADASEDPIFCGVGRSGASIWRRHRATRLRSLTSAFGRSSRWRRRVCRSPPSRSPWFGRRP
jgi:hypothetical protein